MLIIQGLACTDCQKEEKAFISSQRCIVVTHHSPRFDASAIVLSAYASLGVNGTNIKFVPDVPLAPKDVPFLSSLLVTSIPPSPRPYIPTAPADADGEGGSQGQWKVIVGVVVGIGGAIIVASTIAGQIQAESRSELSSCRLS